MPILWQNWFTSKLYLRIYQCTNPRGKIVNRQIGMSTKYYLDWQIKAWLTSIQHGKHGVWFCFGVRARKASYSCSYKGIGTQSLSIFNLVYTCNQVKQWEDAYQNVAKPSLPWQSSPSVFFLHFKEFIIAKK